MSKQVQEKYQISLDAFEGPLDLLLSLIEKEKIDIYDIPIVSITEQYLSYINEWEALKLDIASEFVLMAATLLQLKSRMLLPQIKNKKEAQEKNEDPRKNLVESLLEHKKMKEVALLIAEKHKERQLIFSRSPEDDLSKFSKEEFVELHEPEEANQLLKAYFRLLKKKENINVLKNITIVFDEISVSKKMLQIIKKLRMTKRRMSVYDFLEGSEFNKKELIAVFLAVLELLKKKLVVVWETKESLYLEILTKEKRAEVS